MFARKAKLTDGDLRKAIEAIGRGLVDADLGGGVIKQRIARQGGGKSGRYRTIILFKAGERAFSSGVSPRTSSIASGTMSWLC